MLGPDAPVPPLSLETLDGTRWRWDERKVEGATLLVLLETDCPTCRLALPYLERLRGALEERGDRLVGVSQDGAPETRSMVEEEGLGFPVLRDVDLAASRALDPPSVPAFFLLDGDRVLRSFVGFDKDDLNRTAAELLRAHGLEPVTVAPPHDGAPATRPGCASRHLHAAGEPGAEAVADAPSEGEGPVVQLRPETGRRASRIDLPETDDPWEYCLREGFSTSLPVVPPTEERVERLLEATPLPADRVLGLVPPCYGEATVEKVAANAVMGGCAPELMEVLVPLVRAMCDERFNLHGVQGTTHFATPLVIVNGPVRRRLGFAGGAGVFGDVARSNAAVGRTLQLVMRNVGGARAGEIDMSTLGNPGRFSYCIAENEEASPWPPLHADRGFDADDSAVSLFAAEPPRGVSEHTARSGRQVLDTISLTLSTIWGPRACGRVAALVVLCPEHVRTVERDGFDKEQVRDFLFENTGVPLRLYDAASEGAEGTAGRESYEEIRIRGEPHYRKFSDRSLVRVMVAGGTAGKFSAVIGSWRTGPRGSQMVTYPVGW